MTRWGPEPLAGGGTRFHLWAPDGDGVTLEIDGAEAAAMERGADGWYALDRAEGPGARYRFRIGEQAVPDPASRLQSGGVHGWSVVPETRYDWQHPDWRGRVWHEIVILECHAGTLGGFAGVIERLPAIAATGKPLAMALPKVEMSGVTPNNCCAPPGARRKPVITSSKMRMAPCLVQAARTPSR